MNANAPSLKMRFGAPKPLVIWAQLHAAGSNLAVCWFGENTPFKSRTLAPCASPASFCRSPPHLRSAYSRTLPCFCVFMIQDGKSFATFGKRNLGTTCACHRAHLDPFVVAEVLLVEREHVIGPLRRSIVTRTVLLAPRHLFEVRRATGAHPVRHHRPPCPRLLGQALAPAVILLQADECCTM